MYIIMNTFDNKLDSYIASFTDFIKEKLDLIECVDNQCRPISKQEIESMLRHEIEDVFICESNINIVFKYYVPITLYVLIKLNFVDRNNISRIDYIDFTNEIEQIVSKFLDKELSSLFNNIKINSKKIKKKSLQKLNKNKDLDDITNKLKNILKIRS